MNVVFNINHLGLEGLGATLVSLVQSCSNSKELKLWFLCSDLREKDKSNIAVLLKSVGLKGETKFVDYNARERYGHLRSLHGDWTTYGRLMIPDLVKSDVALYLDADLLITIDVLALKDFDFDNCVLAAVRGSEVSKTFDRTFLIDKLYWSPHCEYFNAGVLLLNLNKWRRENIHEKWQSIAKRYPNELLSHDQTLLNAICEGQFARLPKQFNVLWHPVNAKPDCHNETILHFVGAPKPWDLFGQYLHKGYTYWNAYNLKFWEEEYGKISFDKIKRAWEIRGSLYKNFKANIKLAKA